MPECCSFGFVETLKDKDQEPIRPHAKEPQEYSHCVCLNPGLTLHSAKR